MYRGFESGLVQKMARKQLTPRQADGRCGLKREQASEGEAPLGTKQTRLLHPQMEERGKKVSRLDRICGSILHAAHVPLTATACLFPALASIVSYTLDRQPASHSHHRPILTDADRIDVADPSILLDILLDSLLSSPLLSFRSTGPRRLTTSW